MRGRGFRATAGALSFVLAVAIGGYLDRSRQELPPFHSIYLPSGRYLRYAALGHRELLADVLYVWSIQYYSNERSGRWRYLERLYDVITDLDPRYVAAYSTGALILAMEAHDREAALRLLDRGIEALPQTYALALEAGFYAREAGDHARAARYFQIAKERPDAPRFVRSWYLVTLDRAGSRREALALWRQALAEATTEADRTRAERYIRDLTFDLQLESLREALARFAARFGRPPVRLEELVRQGEIDVIPRDPEGNEFLYDARTGEVKSNAGFLMRHRLKP